MGYRRGAIAILLLLASVAGLRASILGRVFDPTTAGLPKAKVVIQSVTDPDFQVVLEANDYGYFRSGALPPGGYSVEASKEGFFSTRYSTIQVRGQESHWVSLELEIDLDSAVCILDITADEDDSRRAVNGYLWYRGSPRKFRICILENRSYDCYPTDPLTGYYSLRLHPGRYPVIIYRGDVVAHQQMIEVGEEAEHWELLSIPEATPVD